MLNELRDWERRREHIEARYGTDIYSAQRRHYLSGIQQRWLAGTERLLHSVLLDLVSGAFRTELSEFEIGRTRLRAINLEEVQRQFLFSPTISLELAPLPRKTGEGTTFRERVQNALTDLRASSPRLFPLLTELAVTILLVPPKDKDGDSGIDLDNLATKVIPQVHSILEPPGRRPIPTPSMVADPGLRAFFEAQAKLARSLPKHHITRYEVIELPRTESDPTSGHVRLVLCDGAHGRTFAEAVDKLIEGWEPD